MKSLRYALSVVLLSLCTVAFAQSDAHMSDMQKSSVAPAPSEAQKSFTTMKSLAGEWEGPVTRGRDAADVKRQADARLAARDLAGKRRSCTSSRKQERRWMRPSTTIRSRCFTWTETSSPWFTIATPGTGRA